MMTFWKWTLVGSGLALGAGAAGAGCSSTTIVNNPTDGGQTADTGTTDTGATDTGSTDSGTSDTGATETGTDAGPPLTGTLAYSFNDKPAALQEMHVYTLPLGAGTQTPKAITTAADAVDQPYDFSIDGTQLVLVRDSVANPNHPSVILAKADGTGETIVTSCAFSCYDAAFGADGNLWYVERANNAANGRIRFVAKTAGATPTDWVGNPPANCYIESFKLNFDHTQMLTVLNDANGNGCTAKGIYQNALSAQSLGTAFIPADPRIDPTGTAPFRNAVFNKAGTRIFFIADEPVDGGPPANFGDIFSVSFGGTDVTHELASAAAFVLSSNRIFNIGITPNNPNRSVDAYIIGDVNNNAITVVQPLMGLAYLVWTP